MRLAYLRYVKDINHLALPLVLNAVSMMVMQLIDQAMIGRISLEAYAAVGTLINFLFVIAGVLGALAISFNIYGSRKIGSSDTLAFRSLFIASIFLNIIIGALLMLILLILQKPILSLVYGFEGAILKDGMQYLSIMSVAVLLQLLLFTFSTYFKVVKKTKWIFIGSTAAAIMNVVFNYLFIFGNFGFPRLGVKGVAIASVLSLCLNLFIYIYASKEHLKIYIKQVGQYIHDMKFIIQKSWALLGQEVLEGGVIIIAIEVVIARMGDLELAGYILVSQILAVVLIPMHMYSTAVLTLVSERYAAKKMRDIRRIPQVGLSLTLMFTLILSLLAVYFRSEVTALITNDNGLVIYSSGILLFIILANMFSPVHTVYKSALQAIGSSMYVLVGTAVVNSVAFLLMIGSIYWLGLGMSGVFISLFVSNVVLSLVFYKRYANVVHRLSRID